MEDRRNVGESSCNSGDGTDQMVQSLMLMMMMYTVVFDDNIARIVASSCARYEPIRFVILGHGSKEIILALTTI